MHFELHRGGYKNPVDPVPYFSGQPVTVPNDATDELSPEGTATPSGGTTTRDNGLAGMAAGESNTANCPPNPNGSEPSNIAGQVDRPTDQPGTDASVPGTADEEAASNTDVVPPAEGNDLDPDVPDNVKALEESDVSNKCKGVTGQPYSQNEIRNIIRQECAAAGLDTEDATFLINIAKIESSFNPYATNPTSSATGLFQMLDGTASQNYAAIGIAAPTCEQRADPRLSVRAQIAWYKREWLTYWNNFEGSNRSRINGPIQPSAHSGAFAPFYAGLSKSEFLYGLIHHDGVGNATNGIDKGGLAYWRKKMLS